MFELGFDYHDNKTKINVQLSNRMNWDALITRHFGGPASFGWGPWERLNLSDEKGMLLQLYTGYELTEKLYVDALFAAHDNTISFPGNNDWSYTIYRLIHKLSDNSTFTLSHRICTLTELDRWFNENSLEHIIINEVIMKLDIKLMDNLFVEFYIRDYDRRDEGITHTNDHDQGIQLTYLF